MKPKLDRIRELMAVRQWSASELARHMGVSRSETTRFGDKTKLTVIVPGDSVEELAIKEIGKEAAHETV